LPDGGPCSVEVIYASKLSLRHHPAAGRSRLPDRRQCSVEVVHASKLPVHAPVVSAAQMVWPRLPAQVLAIHTSAAQASRPSAWLPVLAPATQVPAILVQGAAGQVIVANSVWARACVPASRSPFHFFFFFSFFSSNLSAPCPEVTVSCFLFSSLCRKQALQLVFGGRLLLRGGIHVLGREFGNISSRRAKVRLNL
jgi:hypothetical protein